MAVVETKPPRKSIAPPKSEKRICPKCGARYESTDFWDNRDLTVTNGKDRWCKRCVGRCKTREDIEEYFWENDREWSSSTWKIAEKQALDRLSKNATYNAASTAKKEHMLEVATAQTIPAVMNRAEIYKHVDNSKTGFASYVEAKAADKLVDAAPKINPRDRKYSEEFDGTFNQAELQYLERFYKDAGGDDLELGTDRDAVKKLAKAALHVNKAQDDYSLGRCDYGTVKDAISVYDMMMKSTNLAACKRREKNTTDEFSWAEWAAEVEPLGKIYAPVLDWEEDVVDKVIQHFQYTIKATGIGRSGDDDE